MQPTMRYGFAILAVLILAACSERASNPAPPRLTTPLTLPDQPSTIRMPVGIPLANLEKELNREVPQVLHRIDEPQQVCIKTKSKLLPDVSCRLKGTVTRGPIRLSGSGDTLLIRIPIRAVVRAENIGKIIKQETATGALDLTARVKLGLTPGWQPTARIDANYAWTNRIGIDFLGQRISFASKVDPKLKEVLNDLEKSLPRHLGRLHLRDTVQSVWSKGFTSVRAKTEPQIWVRFTPDQIGFSGYRVEGRNLVVGFSARAKTETIFGDRPPDPPVTPVPNLMQALPASGINVHVPVLVRYSVLETAARAAIVGQGPQTLQMKGGVSAEVTFHDISIYGSTGETIAVGVDMSLKALSGAMSPKGKVWFVAIPMVDIEGRTVGIRDVKIAGQTDSKAFNMLLDAVNQTSLRDRLIEAVHYDFSKDYDEGLEKADHWLREQPFEGFVFKGNLLGAQIREVRIAPDGLLVEADAQADAAMTYNPSRAAVLVAERHARRIARERAAAAAASATPGIR